MHLRYISSALLKFVFHAFENAFKTLWISNPFIMHFFTYRNLLSMWNKGWIWMQKIATLIAFVLIMENCSDYGHFIWKSPDYCLKNVDDDIITFV